jgi:hypothetical protein
MVDLYSFIHAHVLTRPKLDTRTQITIFKSKHERGSKLNLDGDQT